MKFVDFLLMLLKTVVLAAIIGFVTFCVLSVIAFIMPQNLQTVMEMLGMVGTDAVNTVVN